MLSILFNIVFSCFRYMYIHAGLISNASFGDESQYTNLNHSPKTVPS